MLTGDSIQTEATPVTGEEEIGTLKMKHTGESKFQPYKILRTLPKDATPEQQDSAIQANFNPGVIHYSARPDTASIPWLKNESGAKIYSFFGHQNVSKSHADSLLYKEINGGRMGIAGDPVPYLVSNDSIMTGLLLGFLILTILMVSRSLRFITFQTKSFFYPERSDSIEMKETAGEVNYQFLLSIQTVSLIALAFYYYFVDTSVDTYMLSDYQLMGLFALCVLGCFLLREALYAWVNWTFFTRRQISESNRSRLFLVSLEGVLLLPVILVYTFFTLPTSFVFISALFIIVFVKLLSFYKSYCIFFRGKVYFLQFFLYFCTLEIAPLATMASILLLIGKLLKITY